MLDRLHSMHWTAPGSIARRSLLLSPLFIIIASCRNREVAFKWRSLLVKTRRTKMAATMMARRVIIHVEETIASKPSSNAAPKLVSKKKLPEYRVVKQTKDAKLGNVEDDPRGEDPNQRITRKATTRGNGRNTESFDPASTLVRPDLRVHVGSNRSSSFDRPLKHDDVVIVPELFGPQDDWSLYYKLVEEMRALQESGAKGTEWVSWHEGAHLICKNPKGSKTFNEVIDRLCEYFQHSQGKHWHQIQLVQG